MENIRRPKDGRAIIEVEPVIISDQVNGGENNPPNQPIPFQTGIDAVAHKILRLPQAKAVVIIGLQTPSPSDAGLCYLFQQEEDPRAQEGWHKDDEPLHRQDSTDIIVRDLSGDTALFQQCKSQIRKDDPLKLAASGAICRRVSWIKIDAVHKSELIRHLAIFPLESSDKSDYYLFVMLSGRLSPIFVRSIRLLIKTSNVFQVLSRSEALRRKKMFQLELNAQVHATAPGTLEHSESQLTTLKMFAEVGFSAVVITDKLHRVVYANSVFCKCIGIDEPNDAIDLQLNYFMFLKQDSLQEDKVVEPMMVSGCHVSGKALYFLVRYQKIQIKDSTLIVYFVEDQTSDAWEQEHRKIYQHQLAAIFDLALVGIFEVNAREECVFSNAYLDRMLGSALISGHSGSWLDLFPVEDQQEIQMNLPVELQHSGLYTKYCQIRTHAGIRLWIRFHACPNQTLDGGFVGTITDETAQRMQEIRLRELAELDQLTGLVNRHVLNARLKNAIEFVDRYGPFVIMCLDLDGFKNINDSLGHDVGDALLIEVSKRLRRVTRQVDVVARMGGDEFVILLANGLTEAAASRVANSLISEVRKPFDVANRMLYVTVSIGIVFCDDSTVSAASLLKRGDMALYQAKGIGRNNFQFFTPELDSAARSKLDTITQLHEALSNNEFYVQYQPQLDVESGRLFGFEALLRWSPKDDNEVQPATFIGLLEDTGLIHDVGAWMLNTCLSDFSQWRKAGWISLDQRLSLNISSLQLLIPGFADGLAESCKTHDLHPSDLILEINETNFMDRVLRGEKVVKELKQREFALAIDDFGTGYSSILALIQLEVDYLKIDTSLMRDIFSDPKGLAVVDSILAIGDRLNIGVIAVGVDHPAKLNYLKDRGCRILQGFVCSRPMTASFLEQELFKSNKHSADGRADQK